MRTEQLRVQRQQAVQKTLEERVVQLVISGRAADDDVERSRRPATRR